jgi:hypothetical protein
LNKRSSGSVPIPPAPTSTAPQPAEPPASPPGADSAFGVLDRFKDEVPQSQDSSSADQATAASTDAAQSEDPSAEKDNLVDLGDETGDDGDTVKSINDALRSLFR